MPSRRAPDGYTSNRCRYFSADTTDTQTDIRIGTRTDRQITSGGNDSKVKRVEDILAKRA
jgi:hypothetical protein